MDQDQFRSAAHSAVDEIIQYFAGLPSQQVLPDVEPGYLKGRLPAAAPLEGEPWSQIQADLETLIKPGVTHWQSPNFMAFFPATVTYPSILGEMYSAAFNAPAFNWLCSPVVTELEIAVMDWIAKALGLPDCFLSTSPTRGGGVIQGSASEAVITVMVAARERYASDMARAEGLDEGSEQWEDRLIEIKSRLVSLGSDQAHSCTAKGARIVSTRHRTVPTRLKDDFAMTGDALREVLEKFAEIKAVLNEREAWKKIWVHVDAAYAGAALVCDEYQYITRDWSEGVDSFNFNMHKWLLVNFDASCLFIRNRLDLTAALDITPHYLRNPHSDAGAVTDYRNWQLPLGRRFRSLKIWFVLRSYGVKAMQAHIRKGIDLGQTFAGFVRNQSDLFELVTPPAFGLTVFHVTEAAARQVAGGDSNSVTREVYERVNAGKEVFLTSSVVEGLYVIRVVSANELAEEKYVRNAFDILFRVTREVLDNPTSAEKMKN
ncbi:Pyridoxal phosphate-dependent decarboxylase [Trichophyton interdigitale]|uniref:Pyridoxal phosphate-dependent decarboxylase n=1 Tax=Trichophyton interdigitale TaxID=101480 RepID=A0A9P5CZH7_9EURO|nr:Pyridoxal phosphate-dependent decarboxylase [Trichophyton interdigitale]KAF3900435.1 Pyridoxal phosphate-dependent decarboxylase [Trichophyton interdigitale]KAG8211260.1 Pyridoxal phosphate-dependent decarboxylase [Trichophyton interdigitale]